MGKMIFYLIMGSLLIPLTVSGCANVAKTDELKHTAWIPTNSQLLKQPVDLKNCLDKEQHLVARDFAVKGIGIILHPNVFSIRTQAWGKVLEPDNNSSPALAKTEVGISVVPYVTDSLKRKFMLLPKLSTSEQPFNKFVPACLPGLQGLGEIIVKMPYYYPTVIVKVIPEQRDNLIQFLHQQRQADCQLGESTATPIVPSQTIHNKSLEFFLTEILNKPEALFLHAFANVQEIILDETQIKFQVGKADPSVTKPVIPSNQSVITNPIQIQFTWPKILGKLAITGCETPQEADSEYITTCSFQAGHTYYISKPSSAPQPVEIILTWQEELGQLSIPSCQIPVEDPIGYRSSCAFQTGKTYRIVPPFLSDIAFRPIKTSRRLIVVSLAANFNNDGTGRIIQNSLYNHFKQHQPNSWPFTLLTIGPGRQLSHPVLSSEELPTLMSKDNSDALKERIKQLQFSATDLNALDDLELVDSYILNHELPISEIVYITDNMGIPTQLPRKQLGVPLAWHQEGIQLIVLTTNDCTIWNERALARCTTWQDKQQPTLEKFLTHF
jgi:hypothetical protein